MPFLTVVFMLFMLAVGLYTDLGANQAASNFFYQSHVSSNLWSEQFWRWISPMFLHFNMVHLGSNLLAFWVFASLIEKVHGWRLLLGLIVVCGALSNAAQFFIQGPMFGGMSGVIFGLFGFVLIYGYGVPKPPYRLAPSMIVLVFAWLALGWTGLLGSIANYAHAFGLITGVVGALLVMAWRQLKSNFF